MRPPPKWVYSRLQTYKHVSDPPGKKTTSIVNHRSNTAIVPIFFCTYYNAITVHTNQKYKTSR